MASLGRSITVDAPLDRVAEYLSDLTSSVEWDPHTVACRRLDDGPVAVGSRYAHTREFTGYKVTVEFEVVEYEPRARIVWQGDTGLASGREEFVFVDGGGATTVSHTVQVELKGVAARFGARMLQPVMNRIANDGEGVLRARLESLQG